MRAAALISILLLTGCGAVAGPPVAPAGPAAEVKNSAFEALWHDGRAELDGYRLTVDRYGESRRGQAVMIFVTEPFSETRQVKADDPAADPRDTIDALKLNFVRDFRTGIYDYNTMVSLFVRTADFAPVKISFSSAEWCGHVYQELSFGPKGIAQRVSSYFDGESSSETIPARPGGITEDSLYVLLRGLKGDFLAPGSKRTVDLLPSPFASRLGHRPIAWTTATIERSAATEQTEVPAGRFAASVYTVLTGDGRQGTFWIEADSPHRVLRWTWKNAQAAGDTDRTRFLGGLDSGEMTGSDRLEYWKLHAEGDEKYLARIGLSGE